MKLPPTLPKLLLKVRYPSQITLLSWGFCTRAETRRGSAYQQPISIRHLPDSIQVLIPPSLTSHVDSTKHFRSVLNAEGTTRIVRRAPPGRSGNPFILSIASRSEMTLACKAIGAIFSSSSLLSFLSTIGDGTEPRLPRYLNEESFESKSESDRDSAFLTEFESGEEIRFPCV